MDVAINGADGPDAPHTTETAWLDLAPCGTVTACSATAVRLIAAHSPLLALAGQRLMLGTRTPDLRRLVAKALSGQPARALIDRPGRWPLALRCRPIAATQVRLDLRDPEQVSVDPKTLVDLFGLTPAESRVASALCAGLLLADIAHRMRVQPNTVQMHVKRILAKTGTVRQGQLVALLLCTLSLSAPPSPAES